MKDRSEIGIVEATARYEAWLAERIPLVKADLELKHRAMSAGIFPFLRATFYRWAARWRARAGDVAVAPTVLAVGDLHVENFGTWRDAEGRLVWGVNDFDEAWTLPYTNDLVRLATSALIAREYHDLRIDGKEAVSAILDGYREALEEEGHAFVLAEHHTALREMAVYRLHDPETFWDKLESLATVKSPIRRPCWPHCDGPFPSAISRSGSYIASPASGAWGANGSSRWRRGAVGALRGKRRHWPPPPVRWR